MWEWCLGEIGRPLEGHMDEHRKTMKLDESNVSNLVKHMWEEHHTVEIIGREHNLLKTKILLESFILVENNSISQANKDICMIWHKNIWEYLERHKK